MDLNAVKRSYRRYAPVYDSTFRWLLGQKGRRLAADVANERTGRVLEIGVGTGLTLPFYRRDHDVTGIDISPEMLERARERVEKHNLSHVTDLQVQDINALTFPDQSFDIIVAAYVMSVVPDIDQALREVERVTKPGGTVVFVNHFKSKKGARAAVERGMSRYAAQLGWHPDFDFDEMIGRTSLILEDRRDNLPPLGLFTLVKLRKPE
jgi:phosphatidylethanolamine/phosphatidyl-N-methylethanolamine N-methyltransferase